MLELDNMLNQSVIAEMSDLKDTIRVLNFPKKYSNMVIRLK